MASRVNLCRDRLVQRTLMSNFVNVLFGSWSKTLSFSAGSLSFALPLPPAFALSTGAALVLPFPVAARRGRVSMLFVVVDGMRVGRRVERRGRVPDDATSSAILTYRPVCGVWRSISGIKRSGRWKAAQHVNLCKYLGDEACVLMAVRSTVGLRRPLVRATARKPLR